MSPHELSHRRIRNVTVNVKPMKYQIPKQALSQQMSQLVAHDFYDYFAVKYLRAKHPVCAISAWIYWHIDVYGDQELRLPEEQLLSCFKTSARFVSLPICLRTTGKSGSAHANALFIDLHRGTAERFEPHGARAYTMFSDYRYEALDKALAVYFGSEKLNLKYIAPSEYSPVYGPQALEHYIEERGYCAAWSLWYIDMRLSYPDLPRKKLVLALVNKLTLKRKAGTLTAYLLDYVNQVYHIMLIDFPQYRDMFLHFNRYLDLPKNTRKHAAFRAFRKHMSSLVRDKPMKSVHQAIFFKPPTRFVPRDFQVHMTKWNPTIKKYSVISMWSDTSTKSDRKGAPPTR